MKWSLFFSSKFMKSHLAKLIFMIKFKSFEKQTRSFVTVSFNGKTETRAKRQETEKHTLGRPDGDRSSGVDIAYSLHHTAVGDKTFNGCFICLPWMGW